MEADFSGYATKAGLRCKDGRTITSKAFEHMDGKTVPLVWQHQHGDPANVLGHAVLEARDDGLYAYGFFNDTPSGQQTRALVQHGDVKALSIWANELVEKGKNVLHGVVKELSLCLSGANPGALIDNIRIAHSDGEVETLSDEAIIYSGLELEHAAGDDDDDDDDDEETIQDIYDSLNDKQKTVVHFMIGEAVKAGAEGSVEQSETPAEGDLTHQEGNETVTNVFDRTDKDTPGARKHLTHSQLAAIMEDAKRPGMTLKTAFLAHAGEYGIGNIDLLFPDAKALSQTPELISRRMPWVAKVIDGARKSPFSRIKTLSADIRHDEARAKGYIKGRYKKEEWFELQHRITTPTTVYKKQKLDRDDIIDITDLDVVAWLKAEMRLMLQEELARAVLIGDGREVDDEDKIKEANIRPIATDHEFYNRRVVVPANVSGDGFVDVVVRARTTYRGSGSPSLFCTEAFLTDMLLAKDKFGRRLYNTQAELEAALRVKEIVTVDVMEDAKIEGADILAVLVNMADYTLGADQGGQVSMFDDFDIDYNQYKYLIETRCSGTLTRFACAQTFVRATGAVLATATVPTFDPATGVVTIPASTGVTYRNRDTDAVLAAGPQPALDPDESLDVVATPDDGYFFAHNTDNDWLFTRPVA